jgi:hypothetical protein
MGRRQLKIVRLLEPELCLSCRFAERVQSESEGEGGGCVIRCLRLDCDNWDTESAVDAAGPGARDEDA